MATMKEVAAHAQVAISTVSTVINNKACVSEKTRERVERSILELGYTRNPYASSLKRRKSDTIAVLIPNIMSVFFPEILNGIGCAARESGTAIIFCHTNASIADEREYMRIMKNYWIKGIIVDTVADLATEAEYYNFITDELIGENGTSVVVLESDLADTRISTVSVDNLNCAYACTKHLLELGHTRIAHIGGRSDRRFVRLRTEGYRRALTHHGVEIDPALTVHGDFSPVSGYAATKKLLAEGHDFSAIFAANDQMMIGGIKALKENGLEVPGDVAAVGFDNIFVASLVDPPLTTIDVPRYKMGYKAMSLILHDDHSSADKRNVVYEGNLIVRQSSDPNARASWDLNGW